MLPNTLTINETVFVKDNDNTSAGTVYSYGSGFATYYIAVRHTKPGLGKAGTVRSLLSLSVPLSDPVALVPTATSGRITVNLTVTYPFGASDAAVADAVAYVGGFLTGTVVSALATDAAAFVDGQS